MDFKITLRPQLKLEVPGEAGKLAERIRNRADGYPVTVVGHYLVIKIPSERQHFWSPQLQVTLEQHGERVQVDGLFTPMPAVWALFFFSTLAVLVLGFFGTIFGLAQWQLEQTPTFLWSLPASLVLLAVIYILALVGQGIGHNQTEELTALLKECLEGTF